MAAEPLAVPSRWIVDSVVLAGHRGCSIYFSFLAPISFMASKDLALLLWTNRNHTDKTMMCIPRPWDGANITPKKWGSKETCTREALVSCVHAHGAQVSLQQTAARTGTARRDRSCNATLRYLTNFARPAVWSTNNQ